MFSRFPASLSVLSSAMLLASSSSVMAATGEQIHSPESQTLDTVVVTATKTENNLATAPASMSVITSDDIMAQPHTNLGEILKKAVGVESQASGTRGRKLISIRGMDSKYTMIMINGRKLSSSNALMRHNDFDLSTIPPDNIERIEIIRGPMSTLYGSEAMGGVINIITKKPANEWHSSLSNDYSRPTTGDGGREYRVGVNSGGALLEDELYLNLSVSQLDRKPWQQSYNGTEITAMEKVDNLSFSGNLGWFVNKQHTVDLDITHNKDKRDSDVMERNSLAVTHGGDFDWGQTQLRYAGEKVQFDEKFSSRPTSDRITEINHVVDGYVSTDLYTHRITTGGDIRYTSLDNPRDFRLTGKRDVKQQAAFIQDEWSFANDWTATYGARVDNHEDFGTHLSPRGYLVYSATDRLTFKGGVGTAFKAPTLLQLADEYRLIVCGGSCWLYGNSKLKPETSTSYELSANYEGIDWAASATVYRNDVKDLIQSQDANRQEDGRDVLVYQNTAKAQIQGIELEGRMTMTDTLSLKANLTYVDARDKSTDSRLTGRPRQSATTQLDWRPVNKLSTFVSATYTGEQKRNSTSTVDGYTTMDLGMNYAFSDTLKVRAGVSNVTNRQLPGDVSLSSYRIDPRTWYLGFTSEF